MFQLGIGMGIGVAAVVLCIGLLVLLVMLGRRRYLQSRDVALVNEVEKPEMEWDNTTLNITVNPFDEESTGVYRYGYEAKNTPLQDKVFKERQARNDEGDDEILGDDDDDDDDEGSISMDDEEEEGIKCLELEWDDSTLMLSHQY